MQVSMLNLKIPFTSINRSKISSTFRDEELFDSNIDRVDDNYRCYDTNEDIMPINYNLVQVLPAYEDCYNVKIVPHLRYSTHVNMPQIDSPDTVENLFIGKDSDLVDACIIKGRNGSKIMASAYNYLQKLISKDFSKKDIVELSNDAKLKRADGSEYIDTDLLEAGLYCAKKFPSEGNISAKALMNSFILQDKDGNEVYHSEAFDFIKNARSHGKKLKTVDDYIDVLNESITYDENGVAEGFSIPKACELYKDKLA